MIVMTLNLQKKRRWTSFEAKKRKRWDPHSKIPKLILTISSSTFPKIECNLGHENTSTLTYKKNPILGQEWLIWRQLLQKITKNKGPIAKTNYTTMLSTKTPHSLDFWITQFGPKMSKKLSSKISQKMELKTKLRQ